VIDGKNRLPLLREKDPPEDLAFAQTADLPRPQHHRDHRQVRGKTACQRRDQAGGRDGPCKDGRGNQHVRGRVHRSGQRGVGMDFSSEAIRRRSG